MATPSSKQLTKLALAFAEHGIEDRDDRLLLCSDHAGRTLTSSRDLTAGEAHDLIGRLEQRVPRDGSLFRVLARLKAARTTR